MKTNKHPKVSVITVSFNAVKEIEKTILSVLNQTYDNIEYIIIDGGSTDGTVDIIKKYADRIAYWVSEPDVGIYFGMNKGIKVATGEWINFMNAGDYFCDSDVLSKMFCDEFIDNIGCLFGNSEEYREGNLYSVKPSPFFKSKKKHFGKGICHQCMFFRTYLLKQHPYNLSFPIAADFETAYWIYRESKKEFLYKDIDVAFYDITGYSNQHAGEAYFEEERIIKQNKIISKNAMIIKGYEINSFKYNAHAYPPPYCASLG
jgi:glycosyltransferase involved in cell wall biosynthesis